jgi:hypothetical protein
MARPTATPAALFAALLASCTAQVAEPEAPVPEPGAAPEPTSEPEPERRRRSFESELIEGVPMYEVLPLDAIPSIDDPRFVSAAEAEEFLLPEETVLGVVGRDGTARAYSAWHLDHHEIVNDVLDGQPITATW